MLNALRVARHTERLDEIVGFYRDEEGYLDNVGTGNPGSFAVGYYRSTDSIITVNDLRIGSYLVSTLPPNQFATGIVSAAISSSVTPGFYYLGAIADFSGAIAEPGQTHRSAPTT